MTKEQEELINKHTGMIVCETCGGEGSYTIFAGVECEETCRDCNGTGLIKKPYETSSEPDRGSPFAN